MASTVPVQPQGPPQPVLDLQASLRQLDRWDSWRWIAVSVVLLLLCFALFSLSSPLIWKHEELFFQERLEIGIRGLLGLVLLFSAFAFYQQHLLKEMRTKLAKQIGVVAELHGRAEVFERLAIVDPLTGLFNRRFAIERLPIELARATRHEYPLTIVMLDLNDFKRINDTCGHAAGDAALQEFARHMRRSIRSSDLPVRMGGDEFMVILPECTAHETEHPLQRMGGCSFEFNGSRIAVPFAIGTAEYRKGEMSHELLQRADDQLYEAKKKKRRPAAISGDLAPSPSGSADNPDGNAVEQGRALYASIEADTPTR
jgi:diguanylate cyclase (GGDEF)-like protein